MLDTDFFRRWMTAAAASVEREANHLTELDSAIGDADHGSNLQRGFAAVTEVLEKDSPATPVRCSPWRDGGSSPPSAGRRARCAGRSCAVRARRSATTARWRGHSSPRRSRRGWPRWGSWAGPRPGTRRCSTRCCRAARRHLATSFGGAANAAGRARRQRCRCRRARAGQLPRRAQRRASGPGRHLGGAARRGPGGHGDGDGRSGRVSDEQQVGIVLVSHSGPVAESVAELARGSPPEGDRAGRPGRRAAQRRSRDERGADRAGRRSVDRAPAPRSWSTWGARSSR